MGSEQLWRLDGVAVEFRLAATDDHYRLIRKNHGVGVGAGMIHRGRPLPLRCRVRKIDDLAGTGKGTAAPDDHDLIGTPREKHTCPFTPPTEIREVNELPETRIEIKRSSKILGPDMGDLARVQQVQARIQRHFALTLGDHLQPEARGKYFHDRVEFAKPVDAGEDQHPPVAKGEIGRIPPAVDHQLELCPPSRERIEDVRELPALGALLAIVVVPAGKVHKPVGEERLSTAEQISVHRNRIELAGLGIPDDGQRSRTAARVGIMQHLAGGQHCRVDRDDRPRLGR